MRARGALTAIVLLVLVFGLGGYLARKHFGSGLSIPDNPLNCSASGNVSLDAEQMANASTVAAVGLRRGVPDRAIVVALAVTLQESKLRNLEHLGRRNDHDSLGLFQQRPSQGWGTADQILDQRYAAERFYEALRRVKGWEKMRVTEAAQEVQRSAHPEAYQKWADEAEVLAAALSGHEIGAISCEAAPEPEKTGQVAADETVALLQRDFGAKSPKAVTEQHTIHLTAKDSKTGWQFAHWLVAQAGQTGVTKVSFGSQQWSAEHGSWSSTGRVDEQVIAEVLPAK